MNCIAVKKLLLFSGKPKTRRELGLLNIHASGSTCARLTGGIKPGISAIIQGRHMAMQADGGDLDEALFILHLVKQ